jgi:hypothetical protein
MVDESKKKEDFMGLDKTDLGLGLGGLALAIAIAVGIKTYTDMQKTGQIPNLFPNPQLLAQQQQEMVNSQIAAQAQQDARQEAIQQEAIPPEEPGVSQLTEAETVGVRTVPRRSSQGGYDRINI